MILETFNEQYKDYRSRDKIQILCGVDGCNRFDVQNKDSAIRNIKKNGLFRCRICSYTPEGRKRISEANSYKRSDDTKQKMSDAKKAFFQTPAGIEAKKKLSLLTAKGHSENKYENAKRQGWFPSKLNGRWMFYGSSYELRFCSVLELDETVESYDTQIGFNWKGRGRCLDFLIKSKDGTTKAVEVKPEDRLTEQKFIDQINDSREYSESNGWLFEVCTEKTLGMTYQQIRNWSDEYRKNITGIDYTKHRLEMDKKKAKKHYDTKIATDKVEVWCDYCKEIHMPLRLTYDKNIKRNGEYICEKHGGFIAGSKPKKKKVNPYAAEGKKQCNECKNIKLFEEFGIDKAKDDGYSTRCKICRAKAATKKYQENK